MKFNNKPADSNAISETEKKQIDAKLKAISDKLNEVEATANGTKDTVESIVTGDGETIIPVSSGGTAAETPTEARNELLGDLPEIVSDIKDDTIIVCAYPDEDTTSGKLGKRGIVDIYKYFRRKFVTDNVGTGSDIARSHTDATTIADTFDALDDEIETIHEITDTLAADIGDIEKVIPATATEQNKLADKNFVNSSIATNTANYIYKTDAGGDKVPFVSIAELEAYSGTVTNNDYAFVTGTDESGNVFFDRYKANVDGSTVTWAKEYRLNNSSFTAEQWAAIQSGITAGKLAQLESYITPVDVVQLNNMNSVTSNAVASKVNGGFCITARSTAEKIVSIDNFVLKAGVIVCVMFITENSADNPTLNVNDTGAKPIKVVKAGAKVVPVTHTGYWRGATDTSVEMWQPYTILEFMYDGTDWVIVGNPTVESYAAADGSSSYEVKADGLIKQDIVKRIETLLSTNTSTTETFDLYSLGFTKDPNGIYDVGIKLGIYEDGDHYVGVYSDLEGSSTVEELSYSTGGTTQTRQNQINFHIKAQRYITKKIWSAPSSLKFAIVSISPIRSSKME